MKSFFDYLREMETMEFNPQSGEPQVQNDDEGLLGALELALQKHRSKVDKFLRELNDPDIQRIMGMRNDGYPSSDDKDRDGDEVVPSLADLGADDGEGGQGQ